MANTVSCRHTAALFRSFLGTSPYTFRRQPDRVAGLQLLPFRNDPIDVVNVGEDEPFENIVAVETGAVLTDLHEPLPYFFDRCVD